MVCYVDVGQGDSTLILTEKTAVLIDTGDISAAAKVLSLLHSYDVTTLDWCICTHPHADHMGALPELLQYAADSTDFSIQNILLPDLPAELLPSEGFYTESLTKAAAQDIPATTTGQTTLHLDSASLEIIPSPAEITETDSLNDASLCAYLTYGDTSFLFTGDASEKEEAALVENGLLREADVLQVGHHGSGSASTEEFLRTVTPHCAVIPCGADNTYGHPNTETLGRLAAYCGDEIYRTDENGTVCITTDGTELFVTTEK